MFYCHWLKNKMIWKIAMQNRARQKIQVEIQGEEGWSQEATKEARHVENEVMPWPRGNT